MNGASRTPHQYLIIGNGAAGVSAAEIIRQRDSAGRVTIVTDEPYLCYSRPGIAYYLNGQVSSKQLITRSESFYRDHRFDLRHGRVTSLDLTARIAQFADGQALAYDVLLLATGAGAVPARVPGSDLDGVVTFDTMDNAIDIVRRARRAKSAVVVGGGITAMELSEGLRHQGINTHLLQRGDRVWPRLFDERESSIIEHQIRHEGIHLHYNEEIDEILGKSGAVTAVRLKSAREIKCQLVGIAIGVRPNLALVKGLPLEVDQGVLVDEYLQSSQPRLFAAGDVAQVFDRWTREHKLDVLWPSAINEGRAAGYNMVDVAHGRSPAYRYEKGSPFNAALLFGVHLTVIGRVGQGTEKAMEELSYLSRGSSHVWTAPFSTSYRSAWDKEGMNSVRIVMSNGRIVGALLLGNQELADPLRKLIEHEADLGHLQAELMGATGNLPQTILRAWRNWHQSWQ
jgi:NAD(P)H-nitrite reductase large subunit